jgi:dihydroorotase-like cyclic amidohydrolase
MELQGQVVMTLVGGRVVWRTDQKTAEGAAVASKDRV